MAAAAVWLEDVDASPLSNCSDCAVCCFAAAAARRLAPRAASAKATITEVTKVTLAPRGYIKCHGGWSGLSTMVRFICCGQVVV